ncbi:MAG: cob(I)yrinic acid a,c-diamide adenosyltransferase [Thermoplasmata archaeon]|nr:MAG: cob(I)yrinic acid a,c-diamide adenosyltransferase [Thermoplasmata archaeon]
MSEKGLKVGLVHVYTGDGKGKTTAAIGLAMRACGSGLKVYMIQFMKGDIEYGELKAAELLPNFTIKQFGRPSFVDKERPQEEDLVLAREGLAHANEIIRRAEHDILILDELNVALDFKLVDLADVMNLLDSKPDNMEIIITGRNAHDEILKRADYVTNMRNEKHPYYKGIPARNGIEH